MYIICEINNLLVGEIMGLAKIGNSDTLVNEIITQLSQAIIDGDFKPGDKLPSEAELCEQLGVGRNSLREAIRVLNAMGVVKTKRGQGTFLQDTISHEVFNPLIFRLILDPKNTTDVFELRVMVESIVVIMAIYKASPEEIQSIRVLVDETNKLAQSNQSSIDDLIKLDVQFHLSIAKCVHNKLIEAILETLVLMFEPSIKKVLQTENGIDLCLKITMLS